MALKLVSSPSSLCEEGDWAAFHGQGGEGVSGGEVLSKGPSIDSFLSVAVTLYGGFVSVLEIPQNIRVGK